MSINSGFSNGVHWKVREGWLKSEPAMNPNPDYADSHRFDWDSGGLL